MEFSKFASDISRENNVSGSEKMGDNELSAQIDAITMGDEGPEGPDNGQYSKKLKKLRFLFLADVDTESTTRLAEHFVPEAPQFDACVVCGPFAEPGDIGDKVRSTEEDAIALGEMSTTLAQLEAIVCRVVYLAADTDPRSTLIEQLHLTPNAVNIHQRHLNLVAGLNISGYTELVSHLGDKEEPKMDSADDGYDDEKDLTDSVNSILLETSDSSTIINGLLGDLGESGNASIFILNHKFLHTLNTFLFHRPEAMESAGLCLCVIPKSDEVTSRLAGSRMAGTTFLVPKSLRQDGAYSIVEFDMIDDENMWKLTSVETKTL
jgi:hypothetical protein